MKTVQGWWFSKEQKLPNGDGRAIVVGEWLEVSPPIIPCERGLHLSKRALDALYYAPGNLCYRVEGAGEIVWGDDKHACSRRKALWMIDAGPVLHRFARACALDCIHLWDAPDVVIQYLTTGDESMRAAWGAWGAGAARDAAWAAAWAAAWVERGAALNARGAALNARGAARGAALSARDAVAAWNARGAGAAAWDAASDAQNARLEKMLTDYHKGRLDLSSPLPVPERSKP